MSGYDLEQAQRYFRDRTMFSTGVHELDGLLRQDRPDAVVVDVRFPSDYAQGHVPGAINLPKGKWHTARGLRQDAVHYLYCYNQTCHLAAEAAVELTRAGYRVIEVEGGWAGWVANGHPVTTPAAAA